MPISLTPELEADIVLSHYSNANEVIDGALCFWESNEKLIQSMKLEILKKRLAIGADQAKQRKFIN